MMSKIVPMSYSFYPEGVIAPVQQANAECCKSKHNNGHQAGQLRPT